MFPKALKTVLYGFEGGNSSYHDTEKFYAEKIITDNIPDTEKLTWVI